MEYESKNYRKPDGRRLEAALAFLEDYRELLELVEVRTESLDDLEAGIRRLRDPDYMRRLQHKGYRFFPRRRIRRKKPPSES